MVVTVDGIITGEEILFVKNILLPRIVSPSFRTKEEREGQDANAISPVNIRTNKI